MTTTQSRAAVSNPRPSSQWLLTLVGVVLLVVGCLLPWAFVPAILGNVTVLLYPGAMQILMIIVGAIALFFLLLRTGRFAAADRLLDSARGLRALSVTAAAFMVLAVVIIAMQAPGLANADPGVYVSLVGALLMVAGSFRMPSDPKVDPITVHLPSWVEIVVIVVMLAIALFGAAYALGQEDGTIFSLFLLFLAGSVVALARAGLFSWIGVIAQRNRRVITLGAFAVAFLFPFTQNGSDANMSIATQVLIFATTALGLNIVVGLAGLLDLGYIAFLGAGAYVSAMMSHSAFATIGWKPPFIVVVAIAACVSSILGLIIGSPTLRVSGDYLAIVTLAFGEIFRLTVNNLDGNNGPDLTNGPNGIPGIPELEIGSFNFGDTHTLLGIPLGRFANYYFLMLVVAAIIITIFTRLNNSRIGRGWVAIREDEKAAEAMGVNVFGLKLFAFAGGAFLAGMAGSIKAHQDVSVTPDQYIFLESAFLLAAIVLGGMGTVAGVLVGATVLKLLPEKLRFVADYRLLTFGLLLVLMMRFRPEGLVPSRRRALEFHEDDTKLAERIEEAHLEGMTKTEGRA
ncbi:MAG TPA: branched-chain amino acid ABC transporter permease [Dermatophilaceae bacterium]|jgi:branched-chain amino acid transport system permease protein|nr:branched-chain amino acid ABC transporter permease [Dermatophilaceae bacterium]OPZ56224.1 MAG: leucine/isoleucine/valine transporter permease subunit [bacterium ADurb.BinA028]HOA01960.1 branched-chain amino acid ABC transporter permease [Dermatophilaceae bacterium]HOA56690.1 branched-chain amino acid ABC transporter permease [Dermatophilaceae bacterium]HOF37294.1 branched-chain amino acid ABC transporter permease [Dermatophilaceae bacterium]